MRTND
jgi:hypothetical protein